MKRIAIPVFENRISNRLDCSEHILLYFIEKDKIESYETLRLIQSSSSAKLSKLLELGIDVLICNGITDFYSRKLSESNVQVIPWIRGEVKEVICQYMNGELTPFSAKNKLKIKKVYKQAGGHEK
jgi:predicted Fe-Mo cluster-binding NifX family protein